MLDQIVHRLPAIEKNRWRAAGEIYLLHAEAAALGKVQLAATQVPSVMLMHRLFTAAPLHAEEEEGCWVWRCEEILGHASLPGIVGWGEVSDRGGALPIFQSLSY